MPHQRKRHLLRLLENRLKLFPVVGILGARQTGKSTLLRELLSAKRKTRYVTLDRDENKQQALQKPTLFLQNLESDTIQTVCIDEVQKAPVLFDTIKAEVDEKKRSGRFALSRSTEFSKKTGIKDSLTGRIALLRMYPLNLCEIHDITPSLTLIDPSKNKAKKKSKVSLKNIHQWTDRGGMPGIFAVRENSSREALFDAWIETTCTRDMTVFNIPRFNPDLAKRILVAIAKSETPNRNEIAKSLGKTSRQMEPYLEGFKALFVVYEIEPFKTSVGKPLFYLFDSGIAQFLGSNTKRLLQIWFLNECFSQFSYAGESRADIFYSISSKGSRIDFVIETKKTSYAILLSEEESPSTYSLRAVDAFRRRNTSLAVFVLAPCLDIHRLEKNTTILPWTSVV